MDGTLLSKSEAKLTLIKLLDPGTASPESLVEPFKKMSGLLFNDVDTDASLSGLAIVGNPANSTTQGQWQYSINGTTWSNVGTVAEGATALALSADTLIRFVPAIGYSGTPPGLTVRAVDNTYGSSKFTTSTTRVTVDTTSTGGTTAISGGTHATLNTSVAKSLPNLLWRNSGAGENAVWQLNRFALQSSYYLPTTDPSWQIASSTADFNHDGIADILWRNQITGQSAIWQMNNTGLESADFITQVLDVNWQIVGTGDFNGDSKSDLVWRNRASGQNAIWQMDGATLQKGTFITSLVDTNWEIAGVADLGSDSTPEILWRNKQAGKAMIWQLSGFSYAQTSELVDVADPKWSVQPFGADLETAASSAA